MFVFSVASLGSTLDGYIFVFILNTCTDTLKSIWRDTNQILLCATFVLTNSGPPTSLTVLRARLMSVLCTIMTKFYFGHNPADHPRLK